MRLPDPRELLAVPRRVFERFPLTAWVALALGSVLVWWVYHLDSKDPSEIVVRLAMALSWAISLSFLAELHSRGRSGVMAFGLPVLALAIPAAWFLLVPVPIGRNNAVLYQLLVVATHLAVSLSRGSDHDEFWHWNRLLLQRFVETWAFAGVLGLGLSGALLTLDNLVGVDIPPRLYGICWIVVGTAFTILHFLSGIPSRTEPVPREFPVSMRVFATRVLLPLAALYMVILYAYGAKILATWTLPEGLVSAPILAFAGFGILAQLLLFPLAQESGARWARLWVRWFHALLIPLCFLLGVAIGRRVSDYGLTEERYLILVLAIWLVVQAAWFMSGRRNLRFVPVSLLVMSLLGGWGPWGAFEASRRSQIGRLEILLDSLQVKAGAKPGIEVDRKAASRVTDLVEYLADHHEGRGLERWVAGLDTVGTEAYRGGSSRAEAFLEAVRIPRVGRWEAEAVEDQPVVLTWQMGKTRFSPRTRLDAWNLTLSPMRPTSEILPVEFEGQAYGFPMVGLDTLAATHSSWSSLDSQMVLHDTNGAADILLTQARVQRDTASPSGWSTTELTGYLLR